MSTSLHHDPVLSGLPAPAGAYSHVVRVGDQLWTCGFGPHDPRTGAFPDGIEAQTVQAITNLETLLGHYGAGLESVVRMRVHLAELDRDFAAYDAAYAARMPAPYPVRTTVGSDLMGFLIEIDADCHLAPDTAGGS